ncbi:hypothetical protein [Nocardioides sp.]|uniref:hypothetical protein n=1 Tax=Nocardioides sp. TaxID=35761 RepID=UPI002639A6F9|nr:hypothetical protein [Nocardioides sp.]
MKAVGLGVAGIALLASPAYASLASVTGAQAWDDSGHTTFSVKDTACDSNSVYGYWNNTSNRLNNSSGCGTTVKKTTSGITSVRACVNKPLASDPCSDWN